MTFSASTGHTAVVLDLVTDGTGRLVATASEDHTVRIFETSSDQKAKPAGCIATLQHDAPVIRVSWAPSRVPGFPIASSTRDGTVTIWKNTSGKHEWLNVYVRRFPAPVAAISWSPEEFGVALACACTDGKIYVLDGSGKQLWNVTSFDAHSTAGCTGVSWAPYLPPGALLTLPLNRAQLESQGGNNVQAPVPRLVTSGNESKVRIWRYDRNSLTWLHEYDLEHSASSLQRDVSWAPNIGIPFSYIAAGSEDGHVTIWVEDGLERMWRTVPLPQFKVSICRVSWSLVGTFLLVSCADGTSSIWQENAVGDWNQVSTLTSASALPHGR